MNRPTLRSFSLHTEAAGTAQPDAFGPFRVLHQIGAGALGPVFRAYDQSGDRLVAVKLFQVELAPERVHQLVADFERLIAAGLNRPGIAAPIATGIAGNSPYLVEEFVSADSLDVLIRDYGPAPAANAAQIAVQLAGALDFAAVVNITHGALHPRDVLLSTDEARLTGLGIVPALEQVGAKGPLRRPYTAPERLGGQRWDRRADIFSLAAIVFEVLTGRRIQGTGRTAADALPEVAGTDVNALRAAFARALAPAPADRFETALEFAAAIRASLSKAPSQTAPASARYAAPAEPPIRVAAAPPVERPKVSPPREEPVVAPTPSVAAAAQLPFDPAEPSDFELRAAETARYDDVQAGPAIIAPGAVQNARPVPPPLLGLGSSGPEPDLTPLQRSQSAMWPLVLALVVGLALGFAAGYGVGNHDRAAAASAAASQSTVQPAAAASGVPAATTGREFTEGSVADSAKAEPPKIESKIEPPSVVPTPRPAARAEPNESEVAARPGGRLTVHSTPSGARVFVDGRERGRTPTTVRDLARGTHRVRVMEDGYAAAERRVTVSGSHAQTITVGLTRSRTEPVAPPAARAAPAAPKPPPPERFLGELTVESRPDGARVFVDGKLVGTSPMLLAQLGAGEHVVRLEHEGYRTWSSSVRVVAGERNRITASLER